MKPVYHNPLPAGWIEKPLKDVTVRRRGYSWDKNQEITVPENGSIPVIRIPNIQDELDLTDLIYLRNVPPEALETSGVTKDWVLFVGSNGNPDRIGDSVLISADRSMVFASFLQGIKTKDPTEILPEFFAQWMRLQNVHQMFSKTSQQTTGLANFSWSAVKKLPLRYPIDVKEQQKINASLSYIQGAINATQQQLLAAQRLETALMQHLFTKGIPERHKKYNSTKYGTRPSSWEKMTCREAIDGPIRNGYSPNCPQDPTGMWILSLENMTTEGYQVEGVKPAPPDDSNLGRCLLAVDDILISRSNTPKLVGLAARYPGMPEPCYYSDLIMRFRANMKICSPAYLEFYLQSSFARRWFKSRASGTSGSMVKIKRRDIMQMPFFRPDPKEQDEIVALIKASKTSIQTCKEKINALSTFKKTLHQNLLTGMVRVNVGAQV